MATYGIRPVLVVVSTWLVAASVLGAEGDAVRVSPVSDGLTLHVGSRLVLKYRYGGVPAKPYVQELLTPGGVNVLRDAPHDHLHHHALMFALAVDGVSFWTEGDKEGRQVHQSSRIEVGKDEGGFAEQLAWQLPDGKTVLEEARTIRLHEDRVLRELGVTLLTWRSRLSAAGGVDRKLSGDHYYGLGARFLVSMDQDGKFVNSARAEGKIFRGTERLLRATWCAYTAKADGKSVTVAMFDHPSNVRHPATWFTMTKPFAYLSATLNLHEEPLMLKADQPITLCYGVAVFDGHAAEPQIARLYQFWLSQETSKGAKPPGK
ncbi:MAG: PmoA family protein [Phycisphaerae bacterium]|nr:PmoA family protein [Phycisphaerae bacterium]